MYGLVGNGNSELNGFIILSCDLEAHAFMESNRRLIGFVNMALQRGDAVLLDDCQELPKQLAKNWS